MTNDNGELKACRECKGTGRRVNHGPFGSGFGTCNYCIGKGSVPRTHPDSRDDGLLPDCMMGPNDPCAAYQQLYDKYQEAITALSQAGSGEKFNTGTDSGRAEKAGYEAYYLGATEHDRENLNPYLPYSPFHSYWNSGWEKKKSEPAKPKAEDGELIEEVRQLIRYSKSAGGIAHDFLSCLEKVEAALSSSQSGVDELKTLLPLQQFMQLFKKRSVMRTAHEGKAISGEFDYYEAEIVEHYFRTFEQALGGGNG